MADEIERKIRMNEGLIEDELLMPKQEQEEAQAEDESEPPAALGLGA